MKNGTFVRLIFGSIIAILLILLGHSVLQSGLFYQYDYDELAQFHISYLLLHGLVPTKSFFTIYPPIFNFFLVPLLTFFGSTFMAITMGRLLMVILFGIRIALGILILRKLSYRTSAIFFVALLLLDPFTTFAGMQIRQDNLMFTIYLIGLLLFIHAITRRSTMLFFLSGIGIACSLIINIKMLPSVVPFCLVFFFWSISKKMYGYILPFVLGAFVSIGCFCLYFIANGAFFSMIDQLVIVPYTFMGDSSYPTPFGFFFMPDNTFVYGVGGKPMSWIFVWILLALGFGGMMSVLQKSMESEKKDAKTIIQIILCSSMVLHFLFLISLFVAFIQYYLIVQWYEAFFGSIVLATLMKHIKTPWLKKVFQICLIVLFAYLVKASIEGNIARSKMGVSSIEKKYEKRWQQIPPDAFVFPDLLFRPIPYPLVGGYYIGNNFGQQLFPRFGSIDNMLEEKKVRYLLLTEFSMGYLPLSTRDYIQRHYTKKDEELYIRNK